MLEFRAGDPAGESRSMVDYGRLARQIGNAWLIGTSIYFALTSGQIQGGLPEIRRETNEGLDLFTRLKNTVFITAIRSELAHLLRRRGELDEAQAIFKQTVPAWLELGNLGAVAHDFESLAALAIARGHLERAARLLGAAQALRTRSRAEMAPNEHPEYDAVLAELRSRLDTAALQDAWKTGEVMGLVQAVAYALAEDGSNPVILT